MHVADCRVGLGSWALALDVWGMTYSLKIGCMNAFLAGVWGEERARLRLRLVWRVGRIEGMEG